MQPKEFKKKERIIRLMQDVGLTNETPISQYMDLDYFIKMMEAGRYYVKKKKMFKDKLEKDYPNNLKFCLHPVGGDLPLPEQPNIQAILTENINTHKRLSNLLTSCWTMGENSNILMWQSFTSRLGVQICSTIGDFAGSFINEDYYIWCGKVQYESPQHMDSPIYKIWEKQCHFSDEREVRFIFSKSLEIIEIGKMNSNGVYLPVYPERMIHKVILSPFIDKGAAPMMASMLHKKYSISVDILNVEMEN